MLRFVEVVVELHGNGYVWAGWLRGSESSGAATLRRRWKR